MAKILVVDDDILFAETVADRLSGMHHEAHCAHSMEEGMALAEQGRFDLVLLDVYLPDANGLESIGALRSVAGRPQVIIITGQGDPDGAETAIQYGAWCYLEKHSIHREITLALTRALQYREAQAAAESRARLESLKRERLVGESVSFRACLEGLASAAAAETNVLLTGESGTGKEAFARAIHANSNRSVRNFVVVDCAALPEQLVESVLFGHVRGAFTGADRANRGLVRHADHGVLFLDEVGELPLATQKSFLRVLQERVFRPVGGQEELHSDFRLICATNRDLPAMVREGSFREDLYHRLSGIQLSLPPLRERENDVLLLAGHFIEKLCERYGQEQKECPDDFLQCLKAYSWPGNVRELSHTIESAFSQAIHSPMFFVQHLPVVIRSTYARSSVRAKQSPSLEERPRGAARQAMPLQTWRAARDSFEEAYLRQLLESTRGNMTEAARVSGLSRTRLYQLQKKYLPAA